MMDIELLQEIVFGCAVFTGLGVTAIMIGMTLALAIYGLLLTRNTYRIKFNAFGDKDCTAIIKAKNPIKAEIKFYKNYNCECKITSIEVMK
jgi:hypothetical protein